MDVVTEDVDIVQHHGCRFKAANLLNGRNICLRHGESADGRDVLIGASGTRMTGGAGDDYFIINAGSGKGVVTDFQGGLSDAAGDQIHISRTLATDYDWLMSHAR